MYLYNGEKIGWIVKTQDNEEIVSTPDRCYMFGAWFQESFFAELTVL